MYVTGPSAMGFLDSVCGGCCSGDTVDRDDLPPTHIIQAKDVSGDHPEVEPIDLSDGDEIVEEETGHEPTNEADTPSHLSRLTKRPLKDSRLKPGRRKITLTGAAAAVPPCSAEECVGDIPKVHSSKIAVGAGAYLFYSLENNGSLNFTFTKKTPDSLHGALAYIKPTTEFAPYHYTDDDGCKVMATNLQRAMQSQYTSDRKVFYDTWSKFMKLTSSVNGTLYLLEASGLSPPPKVKLLLYKDGKIHSAESLAAIDLKNCTMVGVLPHSLDHTTLSDNMEERVKFSQICDEYGSVFVL